ncbi:hypothetical protein Aab01nite_32460 [Paractinoplanes abujensis]|nr:hypothetical protein Aab01nite_32460 [Actinoplanes abujensis]
MHRNRTKLLAASGLVALTAATGGIPARAAEPEPPQLLALPLQTLAFTTIAGRAAGSGFSATTEPASNATASLSRAVLPGSETAPGSTVSSGSTASSGGGVSSVVPVTPAAPFSLIGATWADPHAEVDGQVQVRTRAIGSTRWTPWQTLETDGHAPADVRGASDPLWVGPSDAVEARATGAGHPLPQGLRLDLINPDAQDQPARDRAQNDASRAQATDNSTHERALSDRPSQVAGKRALNDTPRAQGGDDIARKRAENEYATSSRTAAHDSEFMVRGAARGPADVVRGATQGSPNLMREPGLLSRGIARRPPDVLRGTARELGLLRGSARQTTVLSLRDERKPADVARGAAALSREDARKPADVARGTAALSREDARKPADVARGTAALSRATAAVARGDARKSAVPLPARPVPRMVTRGGWRANEAIVKGTAEYTGPTQVFFVHHTATGNGYSCAQSASIVRGIQAYQVRSRGWDDVGYNFLIDKCGTVFEGRRGGVGRTVLGAHTAGFNADASSIAVIGNYGGVRVSPRVRTVIAAVAAYKLGAYGNAPGGRVVLTSGGGPRFPKGQRATLWRIAGHRDAGLTACPGNALYAQLPSIRAVAGAAPAGVHVLRIGGTALAARRYFSRGLIQPVWTTSTPSALINRFEVWVDGVLRTAVPNSHRTTRLRLTPGSHTLTVRAMHLSGRSTTVSSRVVVDADSPVFAAKPALALRPGTVSAGAVPLRLRWSVGDGVALGSVGLTRPLAIDLGLTARTRDVAAPPNRATPFTVRALDRAGNAASATVTRTPWVVSEVSAQRRGAWRALRNGGYLGGTAVASSTRGASASWTFSGTSAALVFSQGPRAGRVGVFVDGRPQGMVDLHSASSAPRRVVWSRSWPTGGEHTVRVVVEGTSGRPGVALDGLVYLR